MGEVIRRGAAAGDILADARTTLTNAKERGADWHGLAEEKLSAVLTLAADVEVRLLAATKIALPLLAAIAAADEAADKLLGRVSDDVWNDVGRPLNDPALSILFPGGIAYYADGAVDDQPERMELLAELLEGGVHKRLDASKSKAYAEEIRKGAAALREKLDAARPARVRAELLGRVQNSIARAAHIDLSNLKRAYKANGFSEAEIHKVIPDRPRPDKPPPPAPSPA